MKAPTSLDRSPGIAPSRGLVGASLFFVSLYLVLTQYTADAPLFISALATAVVLAASLLGVAGLCLWLPRAFRWLNRYTGPRVFGQRGPLRLGSFILWSLGAIAMMLPAYSATYPGAANIDILNQWEQATTFTFHDWHPVFHTLLLWLATRLGESYPLVLFVQCVAFGAGIGYLLCTLRAWGLGRGWTWLLFAYLTLNPHTQAMLQYAWKDTALSLVLLMLCPQVVNIVLSKGQWLIRWKNALVFGALLGIATLLRHNALLFTVPLWMLSLQQMSKKRPKALWMLALAPVLLVAMVRGPLYSALGVTSSPEQRRVESVGLPMTVLGDINVKNPEALPPEAAALLDTIATPEQWADTYRLHEYDSIKWTFAASDVLQTVPTLQVLSMAWSAAKNDPRTAFKAFVGLTDMVWSTHKREGGLTAKPNNHWLGYPVPPYPQALHKLLCQAQKALATITSAPALRMLYSSLGLMQLALLLAGLFSLYCRRGAGALLCTMPSLAYNLITMLLLSTNDYRFFHFNLLLTAPYVLVLVATQQEVSL